jgi:hypothetical protein
VIYIHIFLLKMDNQCDIEILEVNDSGEEAELPINKQAKSARIIKDRHCFIPGCFTTSQSKFTLFAPQNEKMLKVWSLKIPREGMTTKNVICEIHFLEDDIIRYWEAKDSAGNIMATVSL